MSEASMFPSPDWDEATAPAQTVAATRNNQWSAQLGWALCAPDGSVIAKVRTQEELEQIVREHNSLHPVAGQDDSLEQRCAALSHMLIVAGGVDREDLSEAAKRDLDKALDDAIDFGHKYHSKPMTPDWIKRFNWLPIAKKLSAHLEVLHGVVIHPSVLELWLEREYESSPEIAALLQ